MDLRPICFAALAMAAILAGPAAAAPPMQTAEIIDPNGFEQPMRAATISIPAGWRAQGQIRWQPRAACQAEATMVEFKASDPSGAFGVEIIPATAWQTNNLPVMQPTGGCPNWRAETPRQFLTALAAKIRPGARVLDYRDRPDLVTVTLPPPASMPGMQQRQTRAGGEILIAYEVNGRPMREIIMAVSDVSVTRMAGVMPGEVREFLLGYSLPGFAMRAPAGQLDFAAGEAIRKTLAIDPAWQARMNGHNNAMAATDARGASDRAAIRAEANRATSDMINQGWRDRQASQDRLHEQRIRQIREETQYANPDGSRVNLPSHYSNAWQTQGGNYIMGNGSFDPNRDLGIGATQLRPTE